MKGLTIRAEEDINYYETGVKVSDTELAAVPLTRHTFQGDRNCSIAYIKLSVSRNSPIRHLRGLESTSVPVIRPARCRPNHPTGFPYD
jgi:hypothetical protein